MTDKTANKVIPCMLIFIIWLGISLMAWSLKCRKIELHNWHKANWCIYPEYINKETPTFVEYIKNQPEAIESFIDYVYKDILCRLW